MNLKDIRKKLNILYISTLIYSFGENLAGGQSVGSSFIGMYIVEAGATPTQIGLFHSITISVRSLLQIIWGRISDISNRRVLFVEVGGIGASLMWIPILYTQNSSLLLVLLTVQAMFISMRLPTWTALIGDIAPIDDRGKITANINLYITISGLAATLIAGYIMINQIGPLSKIYAIPFTAAALFGVIGSLALLPLKEPKQKKTDRKDGNGLKYFLGQVADNRDFTKFTIISLLSNMSLVILLPIISLTLIRIHHVDKMMYALYGVVRCIPLLIFQRKIGHLTDTTGRKHLIMIQRFLYIFVPLMFVHVPSAVYFTIPYLLIGLLHAIQATANQSYLFDLCPPDRRGSFISFFNMVQGLGMFISSFISGCLIEYFTTRQGLVTGLRTVAYISTIARIPTFYLYSKIKEKRDYQSTLYREIFGSTLLKVVGSAADPRARNETQSFYTISRSEPAW